MSERVRVHHDGMMCGWRWWQVVEDGVLGLVIPEHESTDMTGCLNVAKVLMPEVAKVYVFHERIHADACDVVYMLVRHGAEPPKWEAFVPEKKKPGR